MMRAAMVAALCAGSAAQDVLFNGNSLPKQAANTAVLAPYGDNGGVITVLADWLNTPIADYFVTPSFDSDSLTFVPDGNAPGRGASTLAHSGSAPPNACGMGWAKNEASENICFSELEGMRASNWGWTNKIVPDESFDPIPVYIGASHCVGGHHRFDIAVKYEGNTITVDLTPRAHWSLRAAHVYVGKELLPTTRNGAFSDSPGGFPVFVNVNDDSVVTFQTDGSGDDYYFAVHVNVCPGRETPSPPVSPPTPEACPDGSTFYVSQYYCGHAACTAGISGNLPALLVADGFTAHNKRALAFTLPETGDFNHEARVYYREVTEEYTTPQSNGPTKYVGVFATGCDESITPSAPPAKSGPAKTTCAEHCPPDSDGWNSGGAQ